MSYEQLCIRAALKAGELAEALEAVVIHHSALCSKEEPQICGCQECKRRQNLYAEITGFVVTLETSSEFLLRTIKELKCQS